MKSFNSFKPDSYLGIGDMSPEELQQLFQFLQAGFINFWNKRDIYLLPLFQFLQAGFHLLYSRKKYCVCLLSIPSSRIQGKMEEKEKLGEKQLSIPSSRIPHFSSLIGWKCVIPFNSFKPDSTRLHRLEERGLIITFNSFKPDSCINANCSFIFYNFLSIPSSRILYIY